MAAQKLYGTWQQVMHGGREGATVEFLVESVMTIFNRPWSERMVKAGKLEIICAEYRARINAALPEGIVLTGNEFIGPDPEPDHVKELILVSLINEVGLFDLLELHDVDNATTG